MGVLLLGGHGKGLSPEILGHGRHGLRSREHLRREKLGFLRLLGRPTRLLPPLLSPEDGLLANLLTAGEFLLRRDHARPEPLRRILADDRLLNRFHGLDLRQGQPGLHVRPTLLTCLFPDELVDGGSYSGVDQRGLENGLVCRFVQGTTAGIVLQGSATQIQPLLHARKDVLRGKPLELRKARGSLRPRHHRDLGLQRHLRGVDGSVLDFPEERGFRGSEIAESRQAVGAVPRIGRSHTATRKRTTNGATSRLGQEGFRIQGLGVGIRPGDVLGRRPIERPLKRFLKGFTSDGLDCRTNHPTHGATGRLAQSRDNTQGRLCQGARSGFDESLSSSLFRGGSSRQRLTHPALPG